MTTIPAMEDCELECNTCSKRCKGTCGTCGAPFCGRHLYLHAGEGCIEYFEVIRKILLYELVENKEKLASASAC